MKDSWRSQRVFNMRGKYLFGLLDGKGGLKVYSSNSSRKLKTKRSLMTKDKHYLEVSRILKSDKPLLRRCSHSAHHERGDSMINEAFWAVFAVAFT